MHVIEAIEENGSAVGQRFPRRAELAFVLPKVNKLGLEPSTDDKAPRDYLAHQVAREPKDLRTHVQRIHVNIADASAGDSYGALVDLFIALGARGLLLRYRMLDATKHLLDRGQYQALLRALDNGLHAADAIPIASASMLGRGTRGGRHLVERLDRQAATLLDPLDEARSYLEYGQIQEARELLEAALLSEPWRVDLHRDLLEIYQASQDLDSLLVMWSRLDVARDPVSDLWAETTAALGHTMPMRDHGPID